MAHFIRDIIASFLAALLAFLLFLYTVRALYFAPSRDRRRRMPPWLIVAVLIAFLILPKVDVAYAPNRVGSQGKQHA